MRKQSKKYLVDLELGKHIKTNPVLLRMILCAEYTQIDFGYAALSIYQKGGWIDISSKTYLRVKGSEKLYRLKEAQNITIAPTKIQFESTQDWRVFSLFFEPLPIKDCVLDMIEEDKPTVNDFNYYDIKVRVDSATVLSE